jgi:hypothetical protein
MEFSGKGPECQKGYGLHMYSPHYPSPAPTVLCSDTIKHQNIGDNSLYAAIFQILRIKNVWGIFKKPSQFYESLLVSLHSIGDKSTFGLRFILKQIVFRTFLSMLFYNAALRIARESRQSKIDILIYQKHSNSAVKWRKIINP